MHKQCNLFLRSKTFSMGESAVLQEVKYQKRWKSNVIVDFANKKYFPKNQNHNRLPCIVGYYDENYDSTQHISK